MNGDDTRPGTEDERRPASSATPHPEPDPAGGDPVRRAAASDDGPSSEPPAHEQAWAAPHDPQPTPVYREPPGEEPDSPAPHEPRPTPVHREGPDEALFELSDERADVAPTSVDDGGIEEEPARGPDLDFPRPEPASRPARVIALANQKGGVGKTTTVINLGAALAELGYRVLLVDMDPQGSLGVGLGIEPQRLEATVYDLLLDDNASTDEVIRPTNVERLDVMPANIDLAAAELTLVQEVAREHSLRRVLDQVRDSYDFIIVDCPPSLGLLTINGLTASDGVIVPLECEYFALRGMSLLLNTIDKIQSRLNPDLELVGIVATMVDTRTLHAREVLARVHEAFGGSVFKTAIRRTIRFAEAPVAGEPILTYAPESQGTDAYRDLARELLIRES